MSRFKRTAENEFKAAVIDAARDYIRECENPAPDYLYRRRLRDDLAEALTQHDREVQS